MRGTLACAGLATCLVASAADPAGGDAAARLVAAAQASRTTNFQGVMVYRGEDRFEVLRIQHRYKDDSERERLVSLTGEPRQILRIDNRLICVFPKGRTMAVERPPLKGFLAQLTPERVQELAKWYDFRDQGQGRIAGRACRGAAIVPRDGFRYGYEVWTDEETRLPLKISLTGPRGSVLEQVMFTEVAYPTAIPDDAFEAEVDENRFTTITRDLPRLDGAQPPVLLEHGEPTVAFEQLPPGFKIVAHDDRMTQAGDGRVEHLVLSDGLSSVSVFSETTQREEKVFSGVSHMGPVQAYGRTVGSFHVTIVGEVPPQAIRLIGENLRVTLPGTMPGR